MTSLRTTIAAAVCALGVAGLAVAPASASPFHGGPDRAGFGGHGVGGPGWGGPHRGPGWGDHGGWHDHRHGWGGGYWGAGAVGLATGALIGSQFYGAPYAPVYAGGECRVVSTHYDGYGRLVKVVDYRPC